MKNVLWIIILFMITSYSCKEQVTDLKGYYFNQPSPGDSAVVFAPGIFSLTDRLESNIVFSPDGKECYFGVLEIEDNKASYKIYYSKYEKNKWMEQIEAPFSINNDVSDPYLSADGKRLYFSKNGNIWMVERTFEGWSEPQILPLPINSDYREASYTETTDSIVYLASKRPDGFGGYDLWRICRSGSDQFLKAENFGPNMNSSAFDVSPFIAPDGSYLIFGSERNGRRGAAHLYISFNKGKGDWTTPVNMNSSGAKVNNKTAHHSGASLSPDGKYLFFRRHETMMDMDVYWVSANIIDILREKALNN